MPLIEWSHQYSIGIPSIDNQHKKLVGYINQLHVATAQGEASNVLADIFQGLQLYTQEHFAYEEQLFSEHNYPSLEEHKQKHKRLIKRVQQFQLDFEHDVSGAISLELMQFLTHWLTHHILESDREYAPYLIDKGVE